MSSPGNVRALTADDVATAGAVMGRAFADEPIFVAAAGHDADLVAFCTDVFTANLRHALTFGEAWVIGPDPATITGVAYTVTKPEPELTPEQIAEFGYDKLGAAWGIVLGQIGQMETEAVEALGPLEPGWRYLGGIGVEPDLQGRGFGRALLGHLVDRADHRGEVFALITDRPSNVPFYERAGFRTVAEGDSRHAPLHYWSMIRQPR